MDLAKTAKEHYDAGECEQARDLFVRLASEREERLGERHYLTLSAVHSTIYALVKLDRYAKALPLCVRLVQDREIEFGPDDYRTRDARAWLEMVFRKAGRPSHGRALDGLGVAFDYAWIARLLGGED